MSNICQNLIDLISSSSQWVFTKEDCDMVVVEYQIDKFDKTLPNKIILSDLNNRDNICISYFEDDDIFASFNSTNTDSWSNFVNDLNTANKEQYTRIKITIEKNRQDNYISVYYIDKFIEYFEGLSFSNFLSVINNHFSESLIFEVQDINYTNWGTATIAFVAKGNTPVLSSIGEILRKKRVEEARVLCCCELDKYNLVPEDFFSNIHETNPLQRIFQIVCHLYTFSFIFDYSNIKNNTFEYKLNGFKTLGFRINIQKVSNILIDVNSCKTIYTIYQWLYLGGNSSDKMIIARNIVSLNLIEDKLQINDSTFDAILSNYKIYEKENVKQYIQVRNKISELLIDLQAKIGSIVDNFIGDFKKNLITLISFFISVIVIRVISKGDFISGFTDEVILLSIIFLFISFGILWYSRWELSKKIGLFEKHYEQIRTRYKDLLSEPELKEIFEDCDPKNNSSHKSFVKKQQKLYSWLWGLSIFLLFIAILIIYNNNNDSVIVNVLKSIIECCTQNTSQ